MSIKPIKTRKGKSADKLPGVRRVEPWIPVTDDRFVWTRHADVQATWRKYGWLPPSEQMTPVYVEPAQPEWIAQVRRIK